MSNPFDELGISREATQAEVKERWRALCKLHHPDREGGNQVEFIRYRKLYYEAMMLAVQPVTCKACHGRGHVLRQQPGNFASVKLKCHDCGGSGKVQRGGQV